jgi:MarR family transcriptional regulator, organic hydroperoxide resistance regulator
VANNDDFIEISSMFKTFLKGVTQNWNKQGYNISLTQFKALHTLLREGPLKVSQLAGALDMTPAAITGITDQLYAEGYVDKERAEGDRRVVNITLTKKGEDTVNEVIDRHKLVMQSYFEVLPDEDVEHLRRIFAVLISKLDKK